jgi:hypothetical protein
MDLGSSDGKSTSMNAEAQEIRTKRKPKWFEQTEQH